MEKNLNSYVEICEIGAQVEMKWTAEDLAATEWKAGKSINCVYTKDSASPDISLLDEYDTFSPVYLYCM
jgi:hypothetical protein